MCRELTPLKRSEARARLAERRLLDSELRESTLREEVNDLQKRVGNLLAQKREPQCLYEVIHGSQPGQGG